MFEEFLTNKNSWLNGTGPSADIIFSSRIRLARNLNEFPFPSRAIPKQREDILKRLHEVLHKIKVLKKAVFILMEDLTDLDRQFLLERHLVSQEHIVSLKGKGLIVTTQENVSLMINEEDHLRIQVMASGFNLKLCWEIINEIDNDLSKMLNFAFSPSLGYLTSCPTNVGTALRSSCMLHLPALVLTKRLNKVLELLAKISFTTRGLFGEGTQALGDFFQISNQVSLGLSEIELIDNLCGVVNQVKEQEVDARSLLFKKHRLNLEDNVCRSLGILKNSRLISSKEALSHLSMLSLGLDLGIINNIKREEINSLFIIIQPAHLQKIESRVLKEEERDYIRAQVLREKLNAQ
jgi:protein arginine kinase